MAQVEKHALASSLLRADSGGVMGQIALAGGWLLPGRAHSGSYFPKLEFSAQGPGTLGFRNSDPNSNLRDAVLRRRQGNRDTVLAA